MLAGGIDHLGGGLLHDLGQQPVGLAHQGEGRHPLSRDVGARHQCGPVESEQGVALVLGQGPQSVGRVVVVPVDHEEGLLTHHLLGAGDGVGGASRLALDGQLDAQPHGGEVSDVGVEGLVLGADDEHDPADPGVGQGGQAVVDEQVLADGHEGLVTAGGRGGLGGGESGLGAGLGAHAGAETACQDDGGAYLRGRGGVSLSHGNLLSWGGYWPSP